MTGKELPTAPDLTIDLHLKQHLVLCQCQKRSEHKPQCVFVLPAVDLHLCSNALMKCTSGSHRDVVICSGCVMTIPTNCQDMSAWVTLSPFFARQVCVFNPRGLGEEVEKGLECTQHLCFHSIIPPFRLIVSVVCRVLWEA